MRTLSQLFASGVTLRNALYDRGVLKTRKLSRPVISIGNISTGGSGKTPFVIALGELLKQRGIAFDVLSRGYARRSQEIAVVHREGTAAEFGDEPLLIARTLQVPVIVGPDRYQAGCTAESIFPGRLHLLDDGFQHRRLHRDFDIVMLPASDLQDTLLPLGRLREPLSALRRADAVVSGDEVEDEKAITRWMRSSENLWKANRTVQLNGPSGPAVAFCGIARPQQFFDQVKSQHVELVTSVEFPDHHRYSERDIKKLLEAKAASSASCFVTTEKDEINLGPLKERLRPLHLAKLRTELHNGSVVETILKTIEARSGCRL